MQNYQIGVDVGGTKTRVGLVDSRFRLMNLPYSQKEIWLTYRDVRTMATLAHGFIVFPTPTALRYPSYSVEKLQKMLVAYISQAVKALQTYIPSVDISSGAVAFAGVVKDNAIVTKAADLYFSWGKWDGIGGSSDEQPNKEFFLKERLEKQTKMTWFIVNDVIAATCRYTYLPHYQQVQTLALVTISTGVGYAFFNRSADAFGDSNLVSLGHMLVDTSSEALVCDCGDKGHLAAYFSGKAIEKRVREHASQGLDRFVASSLCHLLRERFALMSSEEKKEQLRTAAVIALIRKNITLTNADITAFVQKTSLSEDLLRTNTKEAFLLTMMVTNSEITEAINNKDPFVIDCLDEAMEKFAIGFRHILRQHPEKIVMMGGFVLRIKKVFLDLLIAHLYKGPERQEAGEYLQKNIEWAYNDDLDGVIGAAICAHNDRVQGQVTRSINPDGSTVFEMSAHTEKRTTYIRTRNAFAPHNATLRNALTRNNLVAPKVMVVIDENTTQIGEQQIRCYFEVNCIPVHIHKIASDVDSLSMKDVEATLCAAKTFKLGRRDYLLTVGSKTTLHCGGLAAAIYRRGIPHIFLPLDDNLENLATSHHTVNMQIWGKKESISNHHPPDYIVLDEAFNLHACQIPPTIKMPQIDHYTVAFVHNLLDPQNTRLSSYVPSNKAFVVISEAADVIFGEKIKRYLNVNNIQCRYYQYAGGENNKYFKQVLEIVQQILTAGDPHEILICIGGGVTMDLAGFAASLAGRQYIRIPTTLLGVVDAGIGVKVGCNYQGTKNFLGDFYAPLACLNDREFLKTVSPRDMRAGLAEILKMGIVREPKIIKIIEEYYDRLISERFQTGRYANNLLELATYWMLKELQTNLHEDRTLKRLVDFGHAFSPFLEIKSNHRILHGEAVAIDMALCTELSYIQGYCTKETRERILDILVAVGLPIFDEVCETEGLLQSLKGIHLARGGSLHLPLPERIGKMIFIEHVPYEDLQQTVTYLQTLHEKKKRNRTVALTTGRADDVMSQRLLV
jgi:3-dehydroquinate synthetase/predicted NBD/HSP70 family sugar kinase